ncbi:cupredoxin family copper-binding protein [Candidatus Saganbacteria bacterium]|nr:cupredoxin family copper-binding protein [Candidatus Saganbacteria bacterium]
MKNTAFILLFLIIGPLVLVGCRTQEANGSSSASTTTTLSSGAAVSVNIQDFAFSSSALSISVETTVTWTNRDSVTHTVTVNSGPTSFDSGSITPGSSFSHQFTWAGTYEYHCLPHPYMTGTITVR